MGFLLLSCLQALDRTTPLHNDAARRGVWQVSARSHPQLPHWHRLRKQTQQSAVYPTLPRPSKQQRQRRIPTTWFHRPLASTILNSCCRCASACCQRPVKWRYRGTQCVTGAHAQLPTAAAWNGKTIRKRSWIRDTPRSPSSGSTLSPGSDTTATSKRGGGNEARVMESVGASETVKQCRVYGEVPCSGRRANWVAQQKNVML